jgi:hypothetical protein
MIPSFCCGICRSGPKDCPGGYTWQHTGLWAARVVCGWTAHSSVSCNSIQLHSQTVCYVFSVAGSRKLSHGWVAGPGHREDGSSSIRPEHVACIQQTCSACPPPHNASQRSQSHNISHSMQQWHNQKLPFGNNSTTELQNVKTIPDNTGRIVRRNTPTSCRYCQMQMLHFSVPS